MHITILVFSIVDANMYYEKENLLNYFLFFFLIAYRVAIISFEKEFKFSISLLRRTQAKITLDNFA